MKTSSAWDRIDHAAVRLRLELAPTEICRRIGDPAKNAELVKKQLEYVYTAYCESFSGTKPAEFFSLMYERVISPRIEAARRSFSAASEPLAVLGHAINDPLLMLSRSAHGPNVVPQSLASKILHGRAMDDLSERWRKRMKLEAHNCGSDAAETVAPTGRPRALRADIERVLELKAKGMQMKDIAADVGKTVDACKGIIRRYKKWASI